MKGTNYELTTDQLDVVTGGGGYTGIIKAGVGAMIDETKTKKPKTAWEWIRRFLTLGIGGLIWGAFQKR